MVDPLVLASLEKLFLICQTFFTILTKQNYLNEEVNLHLVFLVAPIANIYRLSWAGTNALAYFAILPMT
jgi:hypothetical protein